MDMSLPRPRGPRTITSVGAGKSIPFPMKGTPMFYISTLVLALVAPAIPGTPDIKLMAKADIFPEKANLDLSGYYTCEGQEGPDKRYKGVAVITKKGDTYLIQWILGSGLNFNGIA